MFTLCASRPLFTGVWPPVREVNITNKGFNENLAKQKKKEKEHFYMQKERRAGREHTATE
jgi:hypothetical protein